MIYYNSEPVELYRCWFVVRKVRSKMAENDVVYIPSHLSPTNQVYFAIDNCDMKIDTPDGKDQLHGTAIAVFQEKDVNYMPLTIELDRSSKVSQGIQPLSIYPQQYCPEPVRKSKTYTSYKEPLSSFETSMQKLLNNVYFLLKAMNISNNKLPTWSAFNSIATDASPVSTFRRWFSIMGDNKTKRKNKNYNNRKPARRFIDIEKNGVINGELDWMPIKQN